MFLLAVAPAPSMCVTGPGGVTMVFTWDVRLVVLSVAVAIVGSFAALECAARLRLAEQAGKRSRRFSILGAALMGLAIWTMHFIGMLALQMPMSVRYSAGWSLLSMLAAAIGAALAFTIINQRQVSAFHVVTGGIAMGVAIAGMHYLGMKSMQVAATINYEPIRFVLSVVIAIGASAGALALAYWLPAQPRWAFWMKAGSAVVMGIAIAGMHYMGMAAARYESTGLGEPAAVQPLVGSLPLRDVVGLAAILFAAALIALTTRSAIDRQRALDAYRQLAADLEARVQSRTAELEATNNDLSAFTYSVSHDLRSPLRTIAGFADVLSESPELGPENLSHVARIRKACSRMDALLSGLLNLANISRAAVQKTDVDLSALAQATLADVMALDPSRRADIAIAPGLHALADATLMASVMQNLLQNAWKFSAKADPARIEFNAEIRDGCPQFYVRDNGVGFAVNDKLFGVFERMHDPAEYPGQGIGLAITKRIIERHGGTIWADSAPGRGTTVWFTVG